jgi:hypothetical protein
MRIARWVLGVMSAIVTVQLITTVAAFGFHSDPLPAPEPPFVVCEDQKYALCAEASCFVYDGVAYCECDELKGDSISLQLSFSSPIGERNVCSVNQQGKTNGYMVSTFSFPSNVEKGGRAAVYTCPGIDNAGSGGVAAPVAYGQCDGGICFKSTTGQRFPGFDRRLQHDEIICSCPISTGATPASSNALGYQVFGPYHPKAAVGKRCDASACAACSVPNPTANGSTIPVGAPTGAAAFLTLRLDGLPLPEINECLCKCTGTGSNTTCTVAEDTTP